MYAKFFKRLFDIVFSLIGLVFFVVVFIIIAPLIWLEDKGPVFYNAKRLGKNGKIFKMYKFRSMKVNAPDVRNADGSTYNGDDDPRLTRVGRFIRKTSIDELPQLINVFIGDMSFIGPRPDLPEHIKEYSKEEKRKLNVLPGITGYNQAYFRNSVEWHERLKHDVYYVDHVSFIFDIRIFFKTIISVFKRENIFVKNDKYEIYKLDWDTEYFGVRSGKVTLHKEIDIQDLKNIKKQIKKFDFTTISNINNSNQNNNMISKLNAALTDVNIQFQKTIKKNNIIVDKNIFVDEKYSMNKDLTSIAKTAYRFSRFLNDIHLDREKSKSLYYNWLKNSANKEGKYLAYYKTKNKTLGYCLFNLDNNTCVIELIAVDNNQSGKGIGSKLIESVELFSANKNIKTIQVGTQLDNIEAQNFYIKNGFRVVSYNSTYHIWRRQ